jgi:hypothetical protein
MKTHRPIVHLTLPILFLAALTAISAGAQTQTCFTTCPAGATCIDPQDDTWTTLGTTKVDFSNFGSINLTNLLGGTPTSTVVNFNGSPLSSSLGQADTLLSRGLTVVSGTNYSACLSIKGLHLVSSADIQIQGGDTFSVDVQLSNQDGTGHLDFSQTSSDGGTYSSTFNVTPVFTFTDTSNPGALPITVDCADPTYSCTFPLAGGGNWLFTSQTGFDPQSQGVPAVPAGVRIGNGYTTVGRKRFGGIQVGCGGTRSAGYHCNPPDQQDEAHGFIAQASGHNVQPPNDCAQPSSLPSTSGSTFTATGTTGTIGTGTGTTDTATILCDVNLTTTSPSIRR